MVLKLKLMFNSHYIICVAVYNEKYGKVSDMKDMVKKVMYNMLTAPIKYIRCINCFNVNEKCI